MTNSKKNREYYFVRNKKIHIHSSTREKLFSVDSRNILNKDINIVSFIRKNSRVKRVYINGIAGNLIDSDTIVRADSISIAAMQENTKMTNHLPFILYEFLFFDKELSDEEIKMINRYLNIKWKNKDNSGTELLIKNYNNEVLEQHAAFLLLSHGRDGAGGFNSYGSRVKLNEARGLGKENVLFLGIDNVFYTDLYDKELGKGWKKGFDDILRYSNLRELHIEAGK